MNGSHARSTEWGSTNRAIAVRVVCPACGNVKHRRYQGGERGYGDYGMCRAPSDVTHDGICHYFMQRRDLPKKLKGGRG